MKRRLLLTNLALLAILGLLAYFLRQRWMDAEARKQEILAAKPVAGSKLTEAKTAPETPARAASYFDVAEKMLFSKDRNPTVVVEVAKEKVMPPLPSAFGVMDIGTGPVAFLAAKGEPQRGYKPGDNVGEFRLVGVTPQELTFEWDGKTIRKNVDELRAQSPAAAAQPAAETPAQAAPPPAPVATTTTTTTTTTNTNSDSDPWGADAGPGMKLCKPGDTSAPGTVVKGYKKTVGFSPIARTCYWEEQK